MRRCLGKVGGLGIEEQRERSFADSRRYGYCPSDSHRLPHAQVCMGVYNGTGNVQSKRYCVSPASVSTPRTVHKTGSPYHPEIQPSSFLPSAPDFAYTSSRSNSANTPQSYKRTRPQLESQYTQATNARTKTTTHHRASAAASQTPWTLIRFICI